MKAAGEILAGLSLAMLLSGCGGGGGSGSDSSVIAPSLTLVNQVTNDNGGTAVAADWTLTATGYNAADPQTGTYNLSESGPDGYTLTSLTCDNAAGQVTSVTLDPGVNVTCTFVNNDDAPSLTLVNQVTSDNGGTAVAGDWTLTATGYNAADPQTGTYNLSASGPAGYTLTSLTCNNAAGQVTSVTLGLGDVVTCTFVNDDIPSSVTTLAALDLSPGVLDQAFQPSLAVYTATVGFLSPTTTVTPVTSAAAATVTVNGQAVLSGSASAPIPLVVGVNRISVDVTAENGVNTGSYTLTVTRQTDGEFAQQAYIEASTSSSGDNFGDKLALYGDTLAVGVPFEDTNSGAVYIFTRTGTQWSQQAFIKASNTDAGDAFGTSVALSGDTLAVGAYLEDSDASGIGVGDEGNSVLTENSGAVYVFTRDGNTWSQQAYIKASNTGANDRFGASLGLFGDTLVVGANLEDSGSTGISDGMVDNNLAADSGAVYVFTRDGSAWSQQAYIKASNTDSLDNFGYSIAISGDTLAVGAYGEDSDATGIGVGNEGNNGLTGNSGAVYVFTRNAATWSQQAYIKASNTGASDFFGWSLGLSGDTLAVGAVGEASSTRGDQNNNSLTRAGAVYVFTRTGEIWSQQAYIKASGTGETDDFGWSLALSGDNLAVGAPREDSNSTGISIDTGNNDLPNSGAVYLFNRSGTNWNQWAYIKSDRPDIPLGGELFGYSVALDGDTLGAGAPGKDSLSGTTGTGAAFIFR